MIIKIFLTPAKEGTVLLDGSPLIPKNDKELVLEVESDFYDISKNLLISARNGKKTHQEYFKSGKVDLSALCYAGSLEAEISLVANGSIAKRWSITPIILREHDADFTAHDGYAEILHRVEELERKTSVIL